jgi:hypothetical protein
MMTSSSAGAVNPPAISSGCTYMCKHRCTCQTLVTAPRLCHNSQLLWQVLQMWSACFMAGRATATRSTSRQGSCSTYMLTEGKHRCTTQNHSQVSRQGPCHVAMTYSSAHCIDLQKQKDSHCLTNCIDLQKQKDSHCLTNCMQEFSGHQVKHERTARQCWHAWNL